jgi:hypothetical protein
MAKRLLCRDEYAKRSGFDSSKLAEGPLRLLKKHSGDASPTFCNS